MSDVLAVLALLLSVLALVLAALVWRRGGPGRAVGAEELEVVPEDVLGLRQEVAALRAEAELAVRHVAVVRYDAFPDAGGLLSWSVALLDDRGDGVLLTSINGRSEARTYAKNVTGWTGQHLSPEEAQAVGAARP